MKTGYTVSELMTTKPLSCSQDTSLQVCAKLMKDADVTGILVTHNNQLIGIITESDIVKKAVAQALPHTSLVKECMTSQTITTRPGTDIYDAVRLMDKHNIHHLPVVDDGKLQGIITLRTILKIEPQLFELLTERIELRGISPQSSLLRSHSQDFIEGACESCGNYSTHLEDEQGVLLCHNCKGSSD